MELLEAPKDCTTRAFEKFLRFGFVGFVTGAVMCDAITQQNIVTSLYRVKYGLTQARFLGTAAAFWSLGGCSTGDIFNEAKIATACGHGLGLGAAVALLGGSRVGVAGSLVLGSLYSYAFEME